MRLQIGCQDEAQVAERSVRLDEMWMARVSREGPVFWGCRFALARV